MPRDALQTLTEPMYYVLLALLRPLCGIDIMRQVTALSQGRLTIGPGTLYTMLEKFLRGGLITETESKGRRRWYLITPFGKKKLEQEFNRVQTLYADGCSVLKGNP